MRLLQKTVLLISTAALLSACAIVHSKPQLPSASDITPGQTITVQGNQNVYAVARQYNASMRDIIVLNNLQPPYNLHNGETLVLPAGSSGSSYSGGSSYNSGTSMPPPSSALSSAPYSGGIEKESLAPVQPAPVGASPQASSLPPAPPTPAPAVSPAPSQKQSNLLPQHSPATQGPAPVEALNQPTAPSKPVPTTASNIQAAPPPASAPEPTPVPEPPSTSMVWPVQGPILSGFGPKGQGLNNDGINIGAPKGSPVVAASNGIVVYAGSEMKGFGNLVLIRHKDGWVTAYAHLDRMLVQKDAVVAQGDEIGTVGKTGNVPSPQLHFETRYEGKPVDPSTVIKAQ